MDISHGHQEKSRLGRLLVNRGYISEAQLEQGLRHQRESGQRLGEVLVGLGCISERDLRRVLRHQARYRSAAALVTMVTMPFQPLVSLAATNTQVTPAAQSAGQLYETAGLSPMTDEELSASTGQDAGDFLAKVQTVRAMAEAARDSAGGSLADEYTDAIEGLKFAVSTFIPVLNFLHSDLSIIGVHYREGEPRYQVSESGVLELALPERIEQVAMNNIRVSAGASSSLGNVTLSDIQFQAGSHMRVYTR
ncbi:pilus assembly protein PilB [Marinobacter zhejiangensis]|uniref:pilus assembly protein PilB n=1 Tax=Marinobacter zhejiangensis TaxID=488535 RepID=UPI000B885321|nr:pilus assembly protein PilB [Marinobacter zhejiangensis]